VGEEGLYIRSPQPPEIVGLSFFFDNPAIPLERIRFYLPNCTCFKAIKTPYFPGASNSYPQAGHLRRGASFLYFPTQAEREKDNIRTQ